MDKQCNVIISCLLKYSTSNDEVSAGVDMELGLGVQVLLGDGGVDHLLHDVLPQGLEGDLLAVLTGHDHSVHPDRDAGPALEYVLGGDLEQNQFYVLYNCTLTCLIGLAQAVAMATMKDLEKMTGFTFPALLQMKFRLW